MGRAGGSLEGGCQGGRRNSEKGGKQEGCERPVLDTTLLSILSDLPRLNHHRLRSMAASLDQSAAAAAVLRFVLLSYFASQSTSIDAPPCTDRPIMTESGAATTCREFIDSEPSACHEQFCVSCPYAGVCDETCGICGAEFEGIGDGLRPEPPSNLERTEGPGGCEAPSVPDCDGLCINPSSDCLLLSSHLGTCSDWLGNGCCDEGRGGWVTDAGYSPNFNCPMWGCDGEDCETCGEDPWEGVGESRCV